MLKNHITLHKNVFNEGLLIHFPVVSLLNLKFFYCGALVHHSQIFVAGFLCSFCYYFKKTHFQSVKCELSFEEIKLTETAIFVRCYT